MRELTDERAAVPCSILRDRTTMRTVQDPITQALLAWRRGPELTGLTIRQASLSGAGAVQPRQGRRIGGGLSQGHRAVTKSAACQAGTCRGGSAATRCLSPIPSRGGAADILRHRDSQASTRNKGDGQTMPESCSNFCRALRKGGPVLVKSLGLHRAHADQIALAPTQPRRRKVCRNA
jgi:hypothetical protein